MREYPIARFSEAVDGWMELDELSGKLDKNLEQVEQRVAELTAQLEIDRDISNDAERTAALAELQSLNQMRAKLLQSKQVAQQAHDLRLAIVAHHQRKPSRAYVWVGAAAVVSFLAVMIAAVIM